MDKFKVGDRVRSVSGDEGYDGATGVVVLNDGSFWRPLKNQLDAPIKQWGDTYIWRGHDEVEAENTWQPKIGDRVRFTDAVPSHWFFGPTTANKEGVIKSDSGDAGMRYAVSIGDEFGFVDIEHIEPLPVAEQPAALKIEAGKFYRTRDGRKVGPMAQFYDDGKCFESKDTMKGGLWHSDGSAWFNGAEDSPTLVAEWIDEPVAATASNDNAAPAKFKVGDVVVATRDYAEVTKGRHYTIIEVDSDDEDLPIRVTDDAGDGWWLDDGTFELVSPTVAPQQSASTAGFTIPLVDGEPVEKDGMQLTVRITGDFTELHEQIDYAFERLKKLEKKARKLGIDLQLADAA